MTDITTKSKARMAAEKYAPAMVQNMLNLMGEVAAKSMTGILDGVFSEVAAQDAAISAKDAEIARLREALAVFVAYDDACTAVTKSGRGSGLVASYGDAIEAARAALAPVATLPEVGE